MNAPLSPDLDDAQAEHAYVLSFACPFCDAEPGDECKTNVGGDYGGKVGVRRAPMKDAAPVPHKARVLKAGREAIRNRLIPNIEDRPGVCARCNEAWRQHHVERSSGTVTITCPEQRDLFDRGGG